MAEEVINSYSGVSIQTKFTGLAELFPMSGTILESETNKIGDKTLSQIMEEIKPKWNNDLKTNTVEYKTKTVEYLHQGLINHITGLNNSMTVIFENKTLSKGQMLLFDTAERKVTFNHNISITYKALGFETLIKESFEYLLINPRLVPVDNYKDKSDKDVMKIIKGYIDGTTRQGTTKKTFTKQISQPGKIESIGITESGLYMVNHKPINTLPTFDKDITIYMLAPFEDKGLLINDTVSIGVKREPFHMDFEIGTISSQRNMIDGLITNKKDITNQIEIILNKRLENYIPQIVKKYQTMDSLFHNNRDNVGQTLPIYQVLPNPSFPLNHDSENKPEDDAIAILRTIRFYLLFKWMELYYDFYEFCRVKIPITHENGKQTISDPLERCVDTLEFRMYDHQTKLIKKSLLYVLYQLYDFSGVPDDKQIYTPEMLVYDLGKIIETHETSVKPINVPTGTVDDINGNKKTPKSRKPVSALDDTSQATQQPKRPGKTQQAFGSHTTQSSENNSNKGSRGEKKHTFITKPPMNDITSNVTTSRGLRSIPVNNSDFKNATHTITSMDTETDEQKHNKYLAESKRNLDELIANQNTNNKDENNRNTDSDENNRNTVATSLLKNTGELRSNRPKLEPIDHK